MYYTNVLYKKTDGSDWVYFFCFEFQKFGNSIGPEEDEEHLWALWLAALNLFW